MHDLACVVHLHSTHSDGTGTVPEIARAAATRRADVVLLTDHDTLEAKRQRRGGLVRRRAPAGRRGGLAAAARTTTWPSASTRRSATAASTAAAIARAVRDAGGFGFAAHPFSEGVGALQAARHAVRRRSTATHSTGSSCGASPTTRASSSRASPRSCASSRRPARVLDHPPERNMRALGRALPRRGAWSRSAASTRTSSASGSGRSCRVRRDGLPPLASATSARTCSASEPPTRELERDRELVYDALREGRCYIAVDSVAPASGFRFEADGRARWAARRRPDGARCGCARRSPPGCGCSATAPRSPRPQGTSLDADVEEPGVYRVGGPAAVEGARAHLDPVEPDLPALTAT